MQRKLGQFGLLALTLVLVGYVVFILVRPKILPASFQRQPPPWGNAKEHSAARSATPQLRPHAVDNLRSVVAAAITLPEVDAQKIDARSVEALSRLLTRYIEALTSDSVDAYMEIADSERTRWIGASSLQWKAVDSAWKFVHGEPADRKRPREVMRELMQSHRFSEEKRFTRVGTGEQGLRVEVDVSRSAADLMRPLIAERSGTKEHSYWTGGGSHVMRFRDPSVSADQIAKKHGGVVFAQASVLLVTEDNRAGAWVSTWYWNPTSQEWLNESSCIESFHGFAMFY